jgi:serine phosphatase RsbU (regulator of sigma subunit)
MNELRELAAVLESLNQAGSFKQVADRLTHWARTFTGCQSAILRLLEADSGEPWLAGCMVDSAAEAFARDETLVHSAECICGRVATGAIDPALPFYTEGGSFYWGKLSTLANQFSPEQLGPLRGRCNAENFESIAVFPVLAGERRMGSLHLADARPDCFGEPFPVVEAACRLAGDNLLRHRRRDRELALLETIETALLPATPPAVAGLKVGVSFHSATEMAHVGGDFYDVLDVGGGRALVLVGDVSGKGVEAVGIAARARYAIEAQTNLTADPVSFMSAANESLARILPAERFVAAAACLIDLRAGSLITCLAGHPAPLVISPAGVCELDAPHNPPLGLFPGLLFAGETRGLSADEVLLLYTDGITESRHMDGMFGPEGIARAVKALPDRDPQRIAGTVCAMATDFHDASLPGDDRLVVAVRVAENEKDRAHAAG